MHNGIDTIKSRRLQWLYNGVVANGCHQPESRSRAALQAFFASTSIVSFPLQHHDPAKTSTGDQFISPPPSLHPSRPARYRCCESRTTKLRLAAAGILFSWRYEDRKGDRSWLSCCRNKKPSALTTCASRISISMAMKFGLMIKAFTALRRRGISEAGCARNSMHALLMSGDHSARHTTCLMPLSAYRLR